MEKKKKKNSSLKVDRFTWQENHINLKKKIELLTRIDSSSLLTYNDKLFF